MRLQALEDDARVARRPVDPVPEALDVRADASLRHLDVEWDDRAGSGEPRATDRFRHIGPRAETRWRQLDGAPSSISALPQIVDAVGDRIEVHMDGGIRSGQHVLKAIALGAKGTYIGRAMLYGLGAMGQEGVERALEIIRNELDLSMAFCGRTDIRDVDRSILLPGTA